MNRLISGEPSSCALVLVDMQNDFLHPEGAYGRAGQTSEMIGDLKDRLGPVVKAARAAGSLIISTHFTLVPGRGGEPIISPHLKQLRPFLAKGDFCPGSFGHALIDELAPSDFQIEKVAYSAFYMTRLEWVLRKAEISQLIFCGIVSNGGVASTLRDAHSRDFSTVLVEDGCAAFSESLHNNAIASLSAISPVTSCDAIIAAFG